MTAPPTWVCQTSRLRMRPFQGSDHARLMAMHREPRLRALLVDDHALDEPARAWEFLHGLHALQQRHPGLGIWHTERWQATEPQDIAEAQAAVQAGELDPAALQALQAGQWHFCGWFNLMPMPEHPQRVEIGCRLLPSAWGTGLALDGGEALLAQAFGPLQRREVWAVCHPAHRSVHAVLATLGFEALGTSAYCGRPAAHHRLDASAWARTLATPRRERQRAAHHRLQPDTSRRGPIPACRPAAPAVNCGPVPGPAPHEHPAFRTAPPLADV
jgi:RimJ/RimL family protein N-acetyltransferase